MPILLKVLLISIGVFIVVVAVAGGGYWWWQQNGDALRAEARSAAAEGTRFAVGNDEQACVDEAVTRAKGAGMTAALNAASFLMTCRSAARPVAGFAMACPGRTKSSSRYPGTHSAPRTMGSALSGRRSWCRRSSASARAPRRKRPPRPPRIAQHSSARTGSGRRPTTRSSSSKLRMVMRPCGCRPDRCSTVAPSA